MRWALIVLVLIAGFFLSGAVTAWRRRDAPAADLFAVVAALLGVGVLAIVATTILDQPRVLVTATTVGLALVVPIPWLFFCLAYTGRDELVSRRLAIAVLLLPGVGLGATSVIVAAQIVPDFRLPARQAASGLTVVVITSLTLTQWFALLFAGGLLLVSTGMLLLTFSRYDHLDSTTGTLLGTIGTVPWLSLVFGLQVDGIAPFALTQTIAIGLLFGGLAVLVLVGPLRLFERVPAAGNIGPQTVIEELTDLVVVTDDVGTVVELNEAVEQTLNTTPADVVGADVETLLGASLETLRETETLELTSVMGRRLFEPTVSELTDQHGHHLGHALVLRDVTDRITRQQRLEVFNRILRHNLGNDLNVVIGRAERLQAKLDGPAYREDTGAIIETSHGLIDLSEQVRAADRLLSVDDETRAPLSTVLARAFSDVPRSDIVASDVPADVVVAGGADLLALAVQNLVENAIEHNDRDDPHVAIQGDYDPERTYPLSLSVVDDGPGIPAHERQTIEQGGETSMQHGTSIGLWVVRWVTTRLGGELAFRDREPRGTIVSLRLPNAERNGATG
jgi:signal transduction histidine kinase